jgi:hypothetical protein
MFVLIVEVRKELSALGAKQRLKRLPLSMSQNVDSFGDICRCLDYTEVDQRMGGGLIRGGVPGWVAIQTHPNTGVWAACGTKCTQRRPAQQAEQGLHHGDREEVEKQGNEKQGLYASNRSAFQPFTFRLNLLVCPRLRDFLIFETPLLV